MDLGGVRESRDQATEREQRWVLPSTTFPRDPFQVADHLQALDTWIGPRPRRDRNQTRRPAGLFADFDHEVAQGDAWAVDRKHWNGLGNQRGAIPQYRN